jgi:hypothetical protein
LKDGRYYLKNSSRYGPAGEPPSMPDRRGRKVRRAPLPFEKTRIWRRFRGSDPESDPNSGIPLN